MGGLGTSGLQQQSGLSGSILRPTFGPLGGLNPYPNLVGGVGSAPGEHLGQLGNLVAPGLGAGLGGKLEKKNCVSSLCSIGSNTGLTGGLGLGAVAASELPLSPHGDVPPHPDHLSETYGQGDQGKRLGS